MPQNGHHAFVYAYGIPVLSWHVVAKELHYRRLSKQRRRVETSLIPQRPTGRTPLFKPLLHTPDCLPYGSFSRTSAARAIRGWPNKITRRQECTGLISITESS